MTRLFLDGILTCLLGGGYSFTVASSDLSASVYFPQKRYKCPKSKEIKMNCFWLSRPFGKKYYSSYFRVPLPTALECPTKIWVSQGKKTVFFFCDHRAFIFVPSSDRHRGSPSKTVALCFGRRRRLFLPLCDGHNHGHHRKTASSISLPPPIQLSLRAADQGRGHRPFQSVESLWSPGLGQRDRGCVCSGLLGPHSPLVTIF